MAKKHNFKIKEYYLSLSDHIHYAFILRSHYNDMPIIDL